MLGLGLGSQPTTECGIFGSNYAAEFDGGNDRIVLPAQFISYWNHGTGATSTALNFSASLWVNIRDNDGGSSQNMFVIKNDDSNNGFTMQFHRSQLEFRAVAKINRTFKEATYDESGFALADYVNQGWIHLAMTFNHNGQDAGGGSGEIKIYANGVLKETVDQNTDWLDLNVDGSCIGSNESEGGGFADGYIDQLAMFNTALTQLQVSEIYNSGVMTDLTTISGDGVYDPKAVRLVAYYQLENNALDSGPNAYHGTINGAHFTTSQP